MATCTECWMELSELDTSVRAFTSIGVRLALHARVCVAEEEFLTASRELKFCRWRRKKLAAGSFEVGLCECNVHAQPRLWFFMCRESRSDSSESVWLGAA